VSNREAQLKALRLTVREKRECVDSQENFLLQLRRHRLEDLQPEANALLERMRVRLVRAERELGALELCHSMDAARERSAAESGSTTSLPGRLRVLEGGGSPHALRSETRRCD
jgi:hypothetical protein